VKVLLIGFGSIGRRHFDVLKSFPEVSEIRIVTKQELVTEKTYASLAEVPKINDYNYYLIASETNKHFEQLNWLNTQVKGKKIFCEKPLFEKAYPIKGINNEVFIGYVLRFHPLLQKIKSLVKGHTVLNINVACGSYLPNWRANVDYKDSYSAKKEQGGGVLLDLSHELDYTNWIVGELINIKGFQTKVSNLEIDSDDLVSLVARTNEGVVVNLSIDYFSKLAHRKILLNTNEFTIELDLIANKLVQTFISGENQEHELASLERNYLFEKMHQEILFSEEKEYVATLEEGLTLMHQIQKIQDENNE
jgi:CMP-N,N'-diacetyllegionaminic acid synthase